MAELGEFGRARAEHYGESDTFRFHGEPFEIPAGLSSLLLMEFAHTAKVAQSVSETAGARRDRAQAMLAGAGSEESKAAATADLNTALADAQRAEQDAMVGMYEWIRSCIGEAQWSRFRGVVVRDAVQEDELMEVCAAVFAAVAGRPTSRPSESSGGPSSTGVGSMDESALPVATPGLIPPVPASDVVGEPLAGVVVPMTAGQAQRAAYAQQMRSVDDLLFTPSSG